MNIADIISTLHTAQEAITAAEAARDAMLQTTTVVAVLICAVAMCVGMLIKFRGARRRPTEMLMLAAAGLVIGAFAGLVAGSIVGDFRVANNPDLEVLGEQHEQSMGNATRAIAAEVEQGYGVEVPEEAVRIALDNADHDVELFSTIHDGVRKSLGITVDEEEGTVTIFDSTRELGRP